MTAAIFSFFLPFGNRVALKLLKCQRVSKSLSARKYPEKSQRRNSNIPNSQFGARHSVKTGLPSLQRGVDGRNILYLSRTARVSLKKYRLVYPSENLRDKTKRLLSISSSNSNLRRRTMKPFFSFLFFFPREWALWSASQGQGITVEYGWRRECRNGFLTDSSVLHGSSPPIYAHSH